ncbi:MAG TPA: Gfo/Idh/MocA family oxidoreductase [Candidatus Hydrogenedentes bacterium]|nr:Gfo/Idh/MocA family oxidoreductase [Candidatus Hydrogenedentota bacterium]HOV61314.1 Gfo/Idh/MocA family oxidoreductase [Candidatus Hydrogenedentota bacterium]
MRKHAAEEGRVCRRDFLKVVSVVTAFTIVPRRALGGPGYTPPSEELTRAVIGVGGMGRGHLGYTGARTVAVCDVDAKHLQQALDSLPQGVRGCRDFREVLAMPDVDVVHIATPPHWHGLIAIAAAEAGKDIWCEKPMTRTIGEGIRLMEAVERHGRIFRLNTWFRFTDNFYGYGSTVEPIKQIVDSGLLGWPLRVVVGQGTGFDFKFYWSGRTDLTEQPIPPELDYDFWLGPAPYKPYHPHRVHQTFRGYWDYDGGGLGDMGQHYLDPVQYLLNKDDTSPVEIEVDAPRQHPDAAGIWRKIIFRYADGCEIWLDGEGYSNGMPYIKGPDGELYRNLELYVKGKRVYPRGLPKPAPQETDFYQCVRARRTFALNERNGFRSCTLVNLGITAVRLGRNLRFDPDKLEFPGDDEANRMIWQPMRGSWRI